MSLQAGLEAFKERRPRDAVQILKDFSQYYTQRGSKDYIQAQMALVKAYHLAGEAVVFIVGSDNPTSGLAIAVSFTLIFNIAAFFLSPLIMDLTQSWLYKTRWVSLEDVESQSPEAAMVIQQV